MENKNAIRALHCHTKVQIVDMLNTNSHPTYPPAPPPPYTNP